MKMIRLQQFGIPPVCKVSARSKFHGRSFKRLVNAFILVAVGAYSVCAHAQSSDLDVTQEYDKAVKSARQITPLGDSQFGESISMFSGATEFSATEVDIPGNNALKVSLGRRFVIADRGLKNGAERYDLTLGGFGDWDMEIPYLEGTFTQNSGWQVEGANSYARCSAGTPPLSSPNFSSWEVWQGTTLRIPGIGSNKILLRDSAYPAPSDGQTYPWVTDNKTVLRCLSATKNGYPGEAFLALTATGVKYYFDWAIERAAQPLRKGYSTRTDRKRVFLLATRAEDRFGNWVNYTYSGDHLTGIASSDGRAITVTYTGNNITSVNANGKTWSYGYVNSGADDGGLRTVALPTGEQWTYVKQGNLRSPYVPIVPAGETDPCAPSDASYGNPFYYTVTHPSGAAARFAFEQYRINRVPDTTVCSYGTTKFFDTWGVKSRVVNGPGISAHTTTYAATPTYSSSGTWSTITNPDGSKKKMLYGRVAELSNTPPYLDEGLALREQIVSASGSIVRETVNTYQLDPNATTPFLKKIGQPQRFLEPDAGLVRPVSTSVVTQDGSSFTKSAGAISTFDVFARPSQAIRSSASGGSRSETTTYSDNLSKWVIGQIKSVTCTAPASCAGSVITQADYDSTTALPVRYYAFGKLKRTLTYNADGTVATVSDGRDGASLDTTITLSSWKRGTPQSIVYPATPDQATGASETAVVNDDGTIASTTDENGYSTSYLYDDLGRMVQVNYPTGDSPAWNATTQAFGPSPDANFGLPAGHWEQVVKTGNGTKVVHFDAFWRPVVEESFDNGSAALATNTHSYVVKRYDLSGNQVFQSYPLRTLANYTSVTAGVTTTYDALDRTIKTNVPSADSTTGAFITTTSYLNDTSGPYTQVADAKSNVTKTWFQMFDQPDYSRPVKITQPEGVITDIARDVYGKPTSMTRHDASNSVVSTRTYTYNASQELCRTVEPETGATLMGYDAAGNLAWSAAGYASTAACGGPENVATRRVDRTYDARNRLKTLVFPDHLGDTTTTYTPDGLVASLVADNGSSNVVTTAYTYNRRRLLIGERMTWNAINWPILYGYDANGSAASLTYPDSTYVDYAPNALGQATKVGTYATNVTYHPNGAIAQFNYGNGIVHAMTQNDRQLPDRSRDAFDGAPAVVALDDNYSYDGNGNVVAILDGIAGAPSDRTMEYDGLNRLTKATSPLFNDSTANEARYSYDVLDNISTVHMRDRNQFYCYDTATWRLTNIKSGYCSSGATVVGLGYDVQGNVTNKNGQMFAFDYGNRLRSTSNNSTPVSSYVYDGLGRRVRDYTTASKYSLYSKDGRIVYASDGRAGKVTTNVYLGNSLLAELEKDTATAVVTTRYMHTDALGSVVALSNASRYLNRNSYEPYGELINRANYDRPAFTGHVMDSATGITYAQQRYYDSEIGRFMSVDPVGVDDAKSTNFNRYWYGNNNPYSFSDPDGRQVWCPPNACSAPIVINQLGLAADSAQRAADYLHNNIDFRVSGGVGPLGGEFSLMHGNYVGSVTPIAQGAFIGVFFQPKESFSLDLTGKPSTPASADYSFEGGDIFVFGVDGSYNFGGQLEAKPKIGIGIGERTTYGPSFSLSGGGDSPKTGSERSSNGDGFKGYFNVDGRIDSEKLNKDLSN